jgi:peptidoglycan/LPS O-acetylase OafA/YrhL
MAASSDVSTPRYDFLDWLRVLAIFVLLFFHTGMLFVGWDFHLMNAQTIPALRLPMDISHRLRMPLLFIIAGASLWFSLARHGALAVLRERAVRLLVPLAFGMFLIVPPQIYFERLSKHQWDGGYLQFWFQKVLEFQPYPQGNFSWHHLWFILYLFIYAAALLPLLVWWRRSRFAVRAGPWLYLGFLPLAINEALLKPLFPATHAHIGDWYVFNHYLLFTAYGFALASSADNWDWLSLWRYASLGMALTLLIVALGLFETGTVERGGVFDAFIANAFTWCALLAFLGFGRRYLSFSNGLLRWARDASYPVYILHQTLIIAIAYYVIQQPWSPWIKYWIVLAGTVAGCVLGYQYVIRRSALTRLIFGMKAEKARKVMAPGLPESSSGLSSL